jgi:hypothetical protein
MLRLLVCVLFAALLAPAQESVNSASIGGRVVDQQGGAIQGAEVTVRHTETNLKASTVTDATGRFRFPYLRLGLCEITVRSAGFADDVRSLTLTVGSAFELPITLYVAGGETSVDVNAEAAVIEAARTQIAGTVTRTEIADLPLNGRSFLDVALLIPGVSPTNTASTQLFPETSAVPGQGLSINSQRNFSNNFIVDGLSANDDAAGLSGVYYGLDALNELQVVTSGGQAEFGRALGGYFNIVTRSGTNTLHGSAYGYFKNQRFNGSNPILGQKLPLTQAQYGASLGGPIKPDRTFYFANFERRDLNQSGLVTILTPNLAVINNRLAAVGYQGPFIATGVYPNPVHSNVFLGKVDHQISEKDQLSVRYNLYQVNSDNSRGAGALNAVSSAAGLDDLDHAIAISNVLTLSQRVVNETRAQFTYSDLKAEPNDAIGPTVSISGVASFGRLAGSPTARVNKMAEVTDNLSYQAGSHALRAGANFLYNSTTITYPRQIRGSYAFSSLANFLSGTYNNAGFSQTFGNSVVAQGNPNVGFYAQDEWKLHPRLTVNVGLRYDLQFLDTIATDTNNISPRAGLAWTPFASRRTVVRASWGLFYDRIPLRAVANALLSSNNTTNITPASQISVSLSPTQTGAPVFPDIIHALPAAVLANFTTMDPHMQNAYSAQTSVEVEHQLSARTILSVGYQRVRGLHLIASVNQNVPACVAAGTNNGCRPNPNFANNSQYSPAADARYYGLFVSFVQRPSTWSSYRISYTYSKALNDVGEFFFSSPIDAYNIWQDWGRSDDDQRHRLVINGAMHSPLRRGRSVWEKIRNGFQLSGTFQYYSALPFNVTAGTNTVQGSQARPTVDGSFIPRNAGSGFDLINLNVRLSRMFPLAERVSLEAIAEAFNALNHVNGVSLNGVFGPGIYPTNPLPTFRQVTAVADPRALQFAVRLAF